MTCIRIPGGVLCVADDHRISVNGRVYCFEWHSYFGPAVLNRDGSVSKSQPTDVLNAACLWQEQGRRVDDKGLCVWDPSRRRAPPPTPRDAP